MFSFSISIDLIGWLVGWQYEPSWDIVVDANVLKKLKLRKRYNYHVTEIEIKTHTYVVLQCSISATLQYVLWDDEYYKLLLYFEFG